MTDIRELRRLILQTAYHAGEGHIASALSIVDIVWTLYDQVMTPDDVFLLSKGHGCLALYVVLEAKGILTAEDLDQFCKRGGRLGGHPGPDVPGVVAATGSLGHGLPIAVGLAYAKRLKNERGRVFVLVGDGEMDEGSCYEALNLAVRLDLKNIHVIVDLNNSGPAPHGGIELDRESADLDVANNCIEWKGFLARFTNRMMIPHLTYVVTKKGHGIPAMERDPAAWHRRIPTPEEHRQFMEDLA